MSDTGRDQWMSWTMPINKETRIGQWAATQSTSGIVGFGRRSIIWTHPRTIVNTFQ